MKVIVVDVAEVLADVAERHLLERPIKPVPLIPALTMEYSVSISTS